MAEGYPDPTKYIFDFDKADEIAEKLLADQKLFLSPLVWNLRPGTFSAYWSDSNDSIYFYEGRFFLPDSHHRQQAILKAVRLWRAAKRDYPKFSGNRQFKVDLYFLNREDEGNYFFDKNQLPKPTAKSKAYDLTTLDDLSLLAKQTIEHSENLNGNVNRVTDKLTARNPQVITLSTLREMMKTFADTDHVDASELAGMAAIAAQFYDMLAKIRPELGKLEIPERKAGNGIDANSTLSVVAVAAHELCHWQRWRDQREVSHPELLEIDEALTSLEAVHRFAGQLSPHEVRLLVGDAQQRLQMFVQRRLQAFAQQPGLQLNG